MELIKKKIHRTGGGAFLATQIAVLEDVNISDIKPDVKTVLSAHGNILLDEVRAMDHQVQLRGRISFEILYVADLAEYKLACMRGEVPFKEKIGMDECKQGDSICVQTRMDDLNISIVNSRKFSVKALLGLELIVDDEGETEIAIDIDKTNDMEYCKSNYEMTGLVLRKKDIFRIRDSIRLAEEKEEIGEVLWTDLSLAQMEFIPLDEKIQVRGAWKATVLYMTELGSYEWYEYGDSIHSEFACDGCSETMQLVVRDKLGNVNVEAAADGDGEMRLVNLDAGVELDICLYSKETGDFLSDVYSTCQDVEVKTEELHLRDMKESFDERLNLEEKFKIEGEQTVGNVLYNHVIPSIREQFVMNDEIWIKGFLHYYVLYKSLTDEDYAVVDKNIPFERKFTYQNVKAGDVPDVVLRTEKCTLTVENEKSIEMKVTLSAKILVWKEEKIPGITGITVNDMDPGKENELPVYAAFVVDENDTLWKIGKRFYVPVSRIREVNELTSDELEIGQKLLIVR